MPAPSNAQNQLQAIEALLQRIEKANDPAMSAMAKDLVQRLMEFHGAGIERMLEIIHKDAAGQDNVIDALGQDPLVRSLLLLYGLHPDGLEARVQQALEKTRPYLKSHGGNVSLIGVDDAGAVTLRLEGSCHGCASSSATLKLAVEEAIYEAAPDVTAIHVEGAVEESSRSIAFVPLTQLGSNGSGNGHESNSELNQAKPSFSEATRSAV
ncbi:MAG: NifU family protein [Terriglobales bacterium]